MSGLSGLPGAASLPTGVDPAIVFVAQVNRFFTGNPPAMTGIAGAPFPLVAGQIPMPAALGAVAIIQRAASEAFIQFSDDASSQLVDEANNAFADPTGFVNRNLTRVSGTLSAYGDSLGLPKAKLPGAFPIDLKTVALAAGGALVLYLVLKRGQ